MRMVAEYPHLSANECADAVRVRGRALHRRRSGRKQLPQDPLQHRAIEHLFARVVVVEQRRVHARFVRDLLDGRGREALAGKQSLGGVEDRVSGSSVV